MSHHLVVLHEQYLNLLLDGRKRIECRLSKFERPPFQSVEPGDLLWLKLPSRSIHALATAGPCHFHRLREPRELIPTIEPYREQIQAASGFLEDAATWARFLSLIRIETVVAIRPMEVYKSDQRAWVVLDQAPWPGMRISGRGTKVPP